MSPQNSHAIILGTGDGDDPAVGQAFFYLVRPHLLTPSTGNYGHSSDNRERIPFSGDCIL